MRVDRPELSDPYTVLDDLDHIVEILALGRLISFAKLIRQVLFRAIKRKEVDAMVEEPERRGLDHESQRPLGILRLFLCDRRQLTLRG